MAASYESRQAGRERIGRSRPPLETQVQVKVILSKLTTGWSLTAFHDMCATSCPTSVCTTP